MNTTIHKALQLFSAPVITLAMCATAMAADMRSFEDHNGPVQIPADPQRIVALNDHVLSMPLVELGAPLVGSAGRVDSEGKTFLRGIKDLLGVDFHNSDIGYIGNYWEPDIEAIAALNPDLIIAGHFHEAEVVEQMRKIAPTLVIDTDQPLLEFMKQIADAAGVLEAYEARLNRYHARIAEARAVIPNARDIQIPIVLSFDGKVLGWKTYGALTQVMDDIGFAQPGITKNISGDSAEFSAESLPELDGDFIIDTYRVSIGDTPAQARARMAEVLPQWCDVLHACRNHQYLIFPRTFVSATSFASLEMATQLLVSHVGGRDFVPFGG